MGAFREKHEQYIEEYKVERQAANDKILNTSTSPIKMIEEEKTTGELLFMEDVEKYDSFLRKSTYLDSP